MQTSSVSVRLPSASIHSRTAVWGSVFLVGAALFAVAPSARADDLNVAVSSGLGAVAGALIGHSVGGRDGAIVGGALGGAIGASAALENSRPRGGYRTGYPVQTNVYYDSYPVPVVYSAPPVVVRPLPVYQPVYRPVYQPVYRPVAYPVAVPVVYTGRYDSDYRPHHNHGWGERREEHGGYRNDDRYDNPRGHDHDHRGR